VEHTSVSKDFLYILPSSAVAEISDSPLFKGQRLTFPYPSIRPNIEVNDGLLLYYTKGPESESLLPCKAEVTAVNRSANSMTITITEVFNSSVGSSLVKDILQRTSEIGHKRLTSDELNALLDRMGGIRLEERDLLNHVKHYITAKGYYFDEETLYNYHICLKTRPFIILAGLSGTGKSKLSQLYAEAFGSSIENERYLRLPVRPSWNDDRYLLGYMNTVTGEYMTEPAVDFILAAEADHEHLSFFCLDEMNLAHVEYYFSQFLSALEEEQPSFRRIQLMSQRIQKRFQEQGKTLDVPAYLSLPPNLLFTGTINVDETTQPLSDKVIDRANTIEFFAVDLDKIPERQPGSVPLTISAMTWRSYQARQPDTSYRTQILEVGKILNEADLGLGYRVVREMELYLANSKGLLSPEVAFDLQVKQRILPRVRGTEAIRDMLEKLIDFTKNAHLPRSEKRLDEMRFRLKRDGYTSFWR
jgi:MoxR-like ATPase